MGKRFLTEIKTEEVYRELYIVMKVLPKECRQIVLKKLGGESEKEIAASLNISEEMIHCHLIFCREFLQKRLTGLIALAILSRL